MTTDRRDFAIRSDAAVLAASDPALARAASVAGDFAVRLRSPGFATLIWLILCQQVSIEAAEAMFRRLEGILGPVTPEGLLDLDDATMRRCGFTRQKGGYARGLATAAAAGSMPLDDIAGLSDQDAVAALTSLRGVGVWTAENYLIWALGRRDVFPVHDLALQLGWQLLERAEAPVKPHDLEEVAARWSPRRTAAAFLIWHYYLGRRGRA
ncbi:MAG: DNA-3-methyladenine glycosylase 2 family protein [Actinomycetota bacterium]